MARALPHGPSRAQYEHGMERELRGGFLAARVMCRSRQGHDIGRRPLTPSEETSPQGLLDPRDWTHTPPPPPEPDEENI